MYQEEGYTTSNVALDPEMWVDNYGDLLFRYACSRLFDAHRAEDAVQETFLAAIRSRESFKGKSSEKSWLMGILKHKIVDCLRKVCKEFTVENIQELADFEKNSFSQDGHWDKVNSPKRWVHVPMKIIEEKEFLKVLQKCLAELPHRISRAFTLREMENITNKEICKILNVSSTNLSVMLHRGRLALRRCLEIHRFGFKRKRTL